MRIMGGRHKVDIMCAATYQRRAQLPQTLRVYLTVAARRRAVTAHHPILAVHTAERTPRKKDGARAAFARNARLLPVMQSRPHHERALSHAAVSVRTLDPAVTGT